MNETWCQMSVSTTVQNAISGVAEPAHRPDADEADGVVDDAELGMEQHPPQQPHHHGVDEQRREQDQVVDRLEPVGGVEARAPR